MCFLVVFFAFTSVRGKWTNAVHEAFNGPGDRSELTIDDNIFGVHTGWGAGLPNGLHDVSREVPLLELV